MRLSSAGLFAVVIALTLPVGAHAAVRVRRVETGGSDLTNCTITPCATVTHAVQEANDGDTIEIAAGVYTGTVETTKNLAFVGAGNSATAIRGTNGSSGPGHPAFVLPNGGSLEFLEAEGGDGGTSGVAPAVTGYAGGDAIVFKPGGLGQTELKLDAVSAGGGVGGEGSVFSAGGGSALVGEASEGGKSISAEEVGLRSGGGGFETRPAVAIGGGAMSARISDSGILTGVIGAGLKVASGASVTLEGTVVLGPAAAEGGSLTMKRSLVHGQLGGLLVKPGPASSAEARVLDSIVSGDETAVRVQSGSSSQSSRLIARGATIVSEGGTGPALDVESTSTSLPVSATVRNTIVRHTPEGANPEKDLVADAATIDAQYSSFTTSTGENGGTAPAAGSGTNISGDPGFAEPNSLILAPTSPLIDRGDPSIVEPGELDAEGAPRSLDGNHDCIAAPDIGALELTHQSSPPCPPPPKVADAVPVVSGFGMTNRKFAPKGSARPHAKASLKRPKKGTRFTYALSEPAKVAIVIEVRKKKRFDNNRPSFARVTTIAATQPPGKQSTPFSAAVEGKPLKPGKYRATIVATDPAGQASAPQQLGFQIVAG